MKVTVAVREDNPEKNIFRTKYVERVVHYCGDEAYVLLHGMKAFIFMGEAVAHIKYYADK